MKNIIKKAPVMFWEELLYFQHLRRFLSLPELNDYHQFKSSLRATAVAV